MYHGAFNNPKLLEFLGEFIEVSKEMGIGQAEIAYRWVRHHGVLDGGSGDSIVVGASRPDQFEETLGFLERGPLGEEVVGRLEGMWEKVKDAAPHHDTMVKVFQS